MSARRAEANAPEAPSSDRAIETTSVALTAPEPARIAERSSERTGSSTAGGAPLFDRYCVTSLTVPSWPKSPSTATATSSAGKSASIA